MYTSIKIGQIMKKKLCFTILCIACTAMVAQTELQGCYYGDLGMYFKFYGNNYQLIMPNNHLSSEILSEGTVTVVNEELGELSYEESPFVEAIQSIKVSQIHKPSISDSINIQFSIPYDYHKLHITVYADNQPQGYDIIYEKGKDSICTIAPNTHMIGFTIRPERIIPHTGDGEFYGIVEIDSQEYEIVDNNNLIQIEIPILTNTFFEKMYLRKEYIRIISDSIIWRGDTYVKNTKKNF